MSILDATNEVQRPSSWAHLRLERRSPSYWRVTFAHPPINTVTATTIDHDAIARTKAHVDQATLPADTELAAALPDFFGAFGRPGPRARQAKLAELGLNTDGDLERNLGRRVVEAAPDDTT